MYNIKILKYFYRYVLIVSFLKYVICKNRRHVIESYF